MGIVDKFTQYVNEKAKKEPEKGWEKMLLGFHANSFLMKYFPNPNMSKGYQKCESMMMSFVASSMSDTDRYIWGNIFAPAELINAFGINMLSIECISSFLTGYHIEDFFIDYAQSLGIAPTLCSYHKSFIGAVESKVVPTPSYAVTTSITCDGNLNTFRLLHKSANVPFTLLDVPYTDDEESVKYLADQLRELADNLEQRLGRRLDMDRLKEIMAIENETMKELKKFLKLLQKYYYPGRISTQLYFMMALHLKAGSRELLDLLKFMNEDIVTYPEFTGKSIMWVHLLPYYQESLKAYFECSDKYQVIASDILLDYSGYMDPEDPFGSMAKKLIRNAFNGSYSNKAGLIGELVDELNPDAVIHFCHWGCKQASGGSPMLKEEMQKRNVPMLILDGDGIDKRNSHDGQIKTRLEAFLEMIENGD